MARRQGLELNALRREGGFTMTELITVVAIIVVLLGVAFVALTQIQKQMYQMEVNETAREIYVAAQNHLATAAAQDQLKPKGSEGKDATQTATELNLGTLWKAGTDVKDDDNDAEYYFIYNESVPSENLNHPDNENSALHLMLPFGSIDQGIRIGGNYIIRYQPATGKVIDVFYTKPISANKQFGGSLNSGDLPLDGSNNSAARYDHDPVLGWYGGEDGDDAPIILDAPALHIDNGDVLSVTLINPNLESESTELARYNKEHEGQTANLDVKLFVEGEISGAIASVDLKEGNDSKVTDFAANYTAEELLENATLSSDAEAERRFVFTLDDITTNKRNFAAYMNATDNANLQHKDETQFLPGENLKIRAWITTAVSTAHPEKTAPRANVATSATYTVNSLFGSADPEMIASEPPAESPGYKLAIKVNSLRHLSNLTQNVSGFSREALVAACAEKGDSVGSKYKALTNEIKVSQDTNLSWTSFPDRTSYFASKTTAESAVVPGAAPVTPTVARASIHYANGTDSSNTGYFVPVSCGDKLTYEGGGHWITGVKVDSTKMSEGAALTDVGLFSSLANGSTVADLELKDCEMASTAGSAGTLAGTTTNAVVRNVLVRNDLSAANSDTVVQVTGSIAAGGLVGTMNDGSVTGCAAAVLVKATAGPAGGLVGSVSAASGDGAVSPVIDDSYSGGHTKTGTGLYDDAEGATYNVTSDSGDAGGLVGTASGLATTNCYSTCSVKGAAASGIGGFAGSLTGGTVMNCYATGRVSGGQTSDTVAAGGFGSTLPVGAFVGSYSGTDFSGNRYLKIVNYTDKISGAGASTPDSDALKPFDENTETYNAFARENANAIPYDPFLAMRYAGAVEQTAGAGQETGAGQGAGSGEGTDTAQTNVMIGRYPYRTVAGLKGLESGDDYNKLPLHLKEHCGDWPSMETLIQNMAA